MGRREGDEGEEIVLYDELVSCTPLDV
jgi:hypothetical protein